MKIKDFRTIWDSLANSIIGFYLFVMIIFMILIDYQKVMSHARVATLSRLMPDFEYLHRLGAGQEELNKDKLQPYLFYYEKVSQYVPRADAFGILGYIYFHLGKEKKAVTCFRKASALYPDAFNFHYNLGVIYFRRQYYKEAAAELEKAAAASFDKNLNYITSSRIYFPFFSHHADLPLRLRRYLKTGFRNACRLLISSYMNLKDYKRMLYYSSKGIAAALDEDKDFYYFAGLAAFNLGKFEQAGAFFKAYLTVNPDDGNAVYYLGLTLQSLGDPVTAEKVLKKAEALHYNEGGKNSGTDMIFLNIF